jgi:heme A synthase
VPVLLTLLPLLLIGYFAVSKKSSSLVKKFALAALVLIGVSVMVGAFLIFRGSAPVIGGVSREIPERLVRAEGGDFGYLAIFVLLFALLLGIVAFSANREKRARLEQERRRRDEAPDSGKDRY